jgi:transcription elongation factor Elf1
MTQNTGNQFLPNRLQVPEIPNKGDCSSYNKVVDQSLRVRILEDSDEEDEGNESTDQLDEGDVAV